MRAPGVSNWARATLRSRPCRSWPATAWCSAMCRWTWLPLAALGRCGRRTAGAVTAAERPHGLWPHRARRQRPGAAHHEHKDASAEQRAIGEILAASWPPAPATVAGLPDQRQRPGRVPPDRHRRHGRGVTALPVVAHRIQDALQAAGVNSPVQLAELERAHQMQPGGGADGSRRPGRPGAL